MKKIILALPFVILGSPVMAQGYGNSNSQGEGNYYAGGSRGYENSQGAASYYYGGGNGSGQPNNGQYGNGNEGGGGFTSGQ